MTTLNLLKQSKAYLCAILLVSSSSLLAQEPVATSNTEIEGVTLDYFFHQEPDTSSDPDKTTFAVNILDNDPTTDWAGNLPVYNAFAAENGLPSIDDPILTFNLNGSHDLTEIQYVTVTREYLFEVWVSTTDTDDYTEATFVNITPDRTDNVVKNGTSFLTTNTDATYKSFDLGSNPGVTFVNIYCAGRTDSDWNTISELKFFESDATASTSDNELSSFLMYPNPVDDIISLTNLHTNVNKVEVVSLQGVVLVSQNVNGSTANLNTASLANGVYIVNLSDASNSLNASKTIVVRH